MCSSVRISLSDSLWICMCATCQSANGGSGLPVARSGFEHVFVGEEKDGKITGLHNWIQYYLEEKKGNVDYMGWVGKQDADNSDDVNLVSVRFAWADDDPETEVKPMSTMLCGCSIEWELAALTMAFLGGAEEGSAGKGAADNPFTLQVRSTLLPCCLPFEPAWLGKSAPASSRRECAHSESDSRCVLFRVRL